MAETRLDENIVITIKVTAAQRDAMKEIAEREGERLGTWGRRVLLREAQRATKREEKR